MSGSNEGVLFSLEAEQAIVAALFSERGSEAFDRLVLTLKPDDFFVAAHAAVFAAFTALVDEGIPPEPATIASRVKSSVKVDDAIKRTLAEAGSYPFAIENVEQYARLVAEKSAARRVAAGLTEIAKKAGKVGGEITTVDLLREVDALAQNEFRETRGNQILEMPDEALRKTLEWLDRKNSGEMVGLGTGIKALDEFLGGVMATDMVVIGGRPSMGKTCLALNIATHVGLSTAEGQEPPLLAVFSMEMNTEQITLRNLSNIGSIDHDHLRSGLLTDEDYTRLSVAISKYSASNIRIDCDPYVSPAIMRAKLRILQSRAKRPISMILVDYLQLMQPDRQMQMKATEISEISRSLKLIAKEFNAPVFVLSQLNRNVENRPNKRPTMADLRESGGIEQDADTIVLMYRDEYYNPDTEMKGVTELIVAKNRNGETGTIPCGFEGRYQRFADLNRGGSSW